MMWDFYQTAFGPHCEEHAFSHSFSNALWFQLAMTGPGHTKLPALLSDEPLVVWNQISSMWHANAISCLWYMRAVIDAMSQSASLSPPMSPPCAKEGFLCLVHTHVGIFKMYLFLFGLSSTHKRGFCKTPCRVKKFRNREVLVFVCCYLEAILCNTTHGQNSLVS